MNNDDSKYWAGCIAGILAIGVVVLLSFYLIWANAYVLVRLWHWFVVPLFNIQELSLSQAAGLSMIVGFLAKSVSTSKDEDDLKKLINKWLVIILYPWLTLLFGYIIQSFV